MYNPYKWRNFQKFENAKVLMDNFTLIVLPQKTPPAKVEKKTLDYFINVFIEKLKYANAVFLPYLNIFVVGRLIFYELAILFL